MLCECCVVVICLCCESKNASENDSNINWSVHVYFVYKMHWSTDEQEQFKKDLNYKYLFKVQELYEVELGVRTNIDDIY